MSGKTMIVLAKAAALTSGLTVEAFAHGDRGGAAWSALLLMVARASHRPVPCAPVRSGTNMNLAAEASSIHA